MVSRFVYCEKCKNPIIPNTRYRLSEGKVEHVNCDTWDREDEQLQGKEYKGPMSGYTGH